MAENQATFVSAPFFLPLCFPGMWNQGENCMGRRALRKSNKSMQPGLKQHGTHNVEVLFLGPWPWQCTFLLPNLPNPQQDACDQLCPTIFKKHISTDVRHHVDAYPHMHISCTASSRFTNLLLLCPETAPCPEAAAQAAATTTAAADQAADQAADHCKAFPKPLRAAGKSKERKEETKNE